MREEGQGGADHFFRGPRQLYWMDRPFGSVWGPSDGQGGGSGLYDPPSVDEHFLTRLGVSLRVWLRRAIKRINDRTVARVVDMVNYNSLRALYGR